MTFLRSPNIERLKTTRNIPGLIKALGYQKDSIIRRKAAQVLGELRNQLALNALHNSASSDTDGGVRMSAADAIEHIEAIEVFPTDIAIVGGGVAGCYTAWHLARQSRQVYLFEAENRLGGRVLSKLFAGLSCPSELGSMRFGTLHERVQRLIEYFHLEPKPFKFRTSYYVRGKTIPGNSWETVYSLQNQDLINICQIYETRKEPWEVPDAFIIYAIVRCLQAIYFPTNGDFYQKNADFYQHNAQRLDAIVNVLKALVPDTTDWNKISDVDADAWEIIQHYGFISVEEYGVNKDVKLNETGFWNVLQHYLGNEGFLLVHDACGYESIVGNWNAAEAIKWFVDDFQKKQSFVMLAHGSEQIISHLTAEAEHLGCQEKLKHQLTRVRFHQNADYCWELEFAVSEDNSYGKTVVKGKTFVKAKHVILALPQLGLEGIEINLPDSQAQAYEKFRKIYLPAVRREPLFKIFFLYSHPWWLEESFTGRNKVMNLPSGRVYTDLPIRQVYYFGPEWMQDHKPDDMDKSQMKENWGMIMASYSNAHYVNFWGPFRAQLTQTSDRFQQDIPAWNSLDESERRSLEWLLDSPYGAATRMVHKVQGQLDELQGLNHGLCPNPLMAIYMDWGKRPLIGAGWHTWEINSESWAIAEAMINPFPGASLYICGEAYSHNQGWIEGALETADKVLSRGFNFTESDLQNIK